MPQVPLHRIAPLVLLSTAALLAVVGLCGCAAPSKKSLIDTIPPYQVAGGIGLVINLQSPAFGVRPVPGDAAARLESAAGKKRKEASRGPGVIALTIATAPLALLAPLYPPAIELAALPFMAAKATSDANRAADRLQREATQARLDAECGEQLNAAHPDIAEALQEAVPGQSLREAIQIEVGDALQRRAHAPVIPLDLDGTKGWQQKDSFLVEAAERHLSTVVEIDVDALDMSGAFLGNDVGCGYHLKASGKASWWNVGTGLTEARGDMFAGKETLPIDVADPIAFAGQSGKLQMAVAREIRDAMLATLDGSRIRFADPRPDP